MLGNYRLATGTLDIDVEEVTEKQGQNERKCLAYKERTVKAYSLSYKLWQIPLFLKADGECKSNELLILGLGVYQHSLHMASLLWNSHNLFLTGKMRLLLHRCMKTLSSGRLKLPFLNQSNAFDCFDDSNTSFKSYYLGWVQTVCDGFMTYSWVVNMVSQKDQY